jgi:hypothetical protein
VPDDTSHRSGKATCNIRIQPESGYVHLFVEGERTVDTVRRIAREIYAACIKHDCLRALVDVTRMTGQLSIVDQYYLPADDVPKDPVAKRIRVAVIDDEQDRKAWSFFETVVRNAGYKFKIFTDRGAALQWITE